MSVDIWIVIIILAKAYLWKAELIFEDKFNVQNIDRIGFETKLWETKQNNLIQWWAPLLEKVVLLLITLLLF